MTSSSIVLTKSVCFALAMLRAALQKNTNLDPNALWVLMNIYVEDPYQNETRREITFTFLIHSGDKITAYCYLRKEGNSWNSGTITLEFPGDTMSDEHRFDCLLNEEGKLELSPSPVQRN